MSKRSFLGLRYAVILGCASAFASCGGGGGSSSAATFSLRGRLALQQDSGPAPRSFALRASSAAGSSAQLVEDSEPNDHVFSALDLGPITPALDHAASAPLRHRGRLARAGDARDLLRFGPVDAALDGRTLSLRVRADGAELRLHELDAPGLGVRSVASGEELFVRLRAGGDYCLCIERGASAQLSWDFEASVLARDAELPPASARASQLMEASAAAAHRDRVLGSSDFRFLPGEVLVCCPDAESRLAAMGFEKVAGTGDVARWRSRSIVYPQDRAAAQLVHADLLRSVRRSLPQARWVSPNIVTSLEDALAGAPAPALPLEPNDSFFAKKEQFNLTLTRFPEAWDVTTGADDVHIAIVDTGMQVGHPDLASRVSSFGYDFIADKDSAGDGDGIDADPTEPDEFDVFFFHGTYVGGVAAAVTNNSIGISGGTWKGKVLPIRVFGRLGGTSYDRVQAYRYLAGEKNDSGRVLPEDERPKVINLSFAIRIPTAGEHAEIQRLYGQNVKMVAAIDNQALDPAPPLYPAAWPEVLCCSAVDEMLVRTNYSNAADYVDICAPGGTQLAGPKGVITTWALRQQGKLTYVYNSFFGTSVATPLISSALALMESVHPDLHPELARRILAETARDLGPACKDRFYGHGLLVADAAVKRARDLNRDAVTTLNPNSIRIVDTAFADSMQVGNAGGRLVFGMSVASSASASGALSFTVPDFAPGELRVALDRSKSRVGQHTERFDLRSSGGDLAFDVSWRTPIPVGPANFEVWLSGDGRLLQRTRSAADGSFVFDGLAPGEYLLEAGVDRNANGRLGDGQEWYLARRVVVDGSLTGELSGVIPWKNDDD